MRECRAIDRLGDVVDARLDTARLTPRDLDWVQLILAFLAANRAFDYAWLPSGALPVVELAIDAQVWGALFAFTAYAILVGKAGRLHVLVWAGHAVGVVCYGLLAVSGLIRLATHPSEQLVSWWPAPMWGAMCVGFFAVTLLAAWWARRRGRCGGELGFNTIIRASAVVTLLGVITPITPLDGGYQVGPIILTTIMHALIAVRMGPVPIGGALDQRIAGEHQELERPSGPDNC